MLDRRRVVAPPDKKREQLFTERYESLLAWALRLTNHQREAAEDLVQDAFVQFMLGHTALEQIANIDGYLRKMLHYLHLSQMSRSAQLPNHMPLSVVDSEIGCLSQVTQPSRRIQAHEELYQICTYACSRKKSSKTGSVLILRFFLDYCPTEIARILNTSRHCVDQWLRLARREVLHMNQPRRLRLEFSKRISERHQHQLKYLKSGGDIMPRLRQVVFDSCQGECLSQQEFEEAYSNTSTHAVATAKLSHIVSCPKCLDTVNRLLQLPLLSERHRSEACGDQTVSQIIENQPLVKGSPDGAIGFRFQFIGREYF